MLPTIPTIVVSLDPCLRTASAVIAIRMGSEFESPGNFGLAHLLEHMIFRGTIYHPSQVDFVLPFVKLGAKFNGETGRDRTMFYVTSLPSEIPKGLSLLIEMIKQPLFEEKRLAVEKQAVMNELKTAKSEPSAYLQNELLLPNVLKEYFPRYHGPMGEAADVEKSSFQDLLRLYQSAYTIPDKIVISLHGNLLTPVTPEASDVYKLVANLWKSIPYRFHAPSPRELSFNRHQLNASLQEYALRSHGPKSPIVSRPHLSECYVGMGWTSAPVESFDSYVLSWISAFLTGDLVASLYHELRIKRGLVYQIVSNQYGLTETGIFSIKWQTHNYKNVPLIIRLVRKQLEELKHFQNEKALAMWKHWIVTRFTMEKDRSINTAQLYAQQMLLTGNIRPLHEISQIMEGLTCQDIQKVSQKVFNRPVTIAMLHP